MRHDTQERYGRITRFFHWALAFLIGWQLLQFSNRIDEGEHWIGRTLLPWHVSIGMLVLAFVALRIIWTARQPVRPGHDPALAGLVRTGHGLLYAGMVLAPVTGILAVLGGGHPLVVFGVELAAEGNEVPWMAGIGSLHSPIVWLLAALIVGHVGAALWHHFVRRDGVLRRMA
ncbi:MAG: cytochrome b [Burkholderiaceae bacterium]